jgi:copper homeostasis protein
LDRKKFELEICAGNIQSVLAADLGGADRVELCENLNEGGTTPSFGTIAMAKERCSLDVFVLIRPRGGDFVYSEIEFEVMLKDVQSAVELGVDGIVMGCLGEDGTIDYEKCCRLMEAAGGMPVTFHRAFDVTPDPFKALDTIRSLGISRLLTSGQKSRAEDGLVLIKDLHAHAGTNLKIMAGSGINESNIQDIATRAGISAFHATLREDVMAKSSAAGKEVDFNGYKVSSAGRIRKMVRILERLWDTPEG